MNLKVVCSLVALFLCFYFARGQNKVPVTVYYESLDPDSKNFFNSQLYPSLQKPEIANWVNLTLVPYGKSVKTKVDEDQWQFSCRHGTYECLGNKIHACAVHEIEKEAPTPSGQGFNPTTVAFINCLMARAESVTAPGKPAETDFHVENCSIANHDDIENCEKLPIGAVYLAEMGDLTEKLEPPLESIPTIIFNGKYKMEDSQAAKVNFVKALCDHINEQHAKDVPYECKTGWGKFKNNVWEVFHG